jgi:superfamily II DNA or RNA helicase
LESVDQPLLLVVDECHKIGAPSFSEICTKSFPKKLGLSATPERQGDSEGTARIFGFLGPVIDEYTLKDAIKDGHLSTFRYNISTVNLTPLEQNHYDILREKIRQALRFHKEGQPLGEYLESLIFASRRIIRGAEEKIPETLRILKENFEPQHHWLIYCDTSTMMDDLSDIIYQRLNYRPLNYDSRLSPNKRQLILNHFEENGGVILAIKCLDEGVDIPAISHGIVLSSSKTKREWIQRRGRLLRKSTNKEYSVIFDVLALPDESGDETSFVMDEIKRSLEFSEAALNYKKISFEIDRLRRQYDIKLEDIHETEETPRTEDVSNNGSPHGK